MAGPAAETPPIRVPDAYADLPMSTGQIVNALEQDIVFGFLNPRERLVEDALCSRFNCTRHVIRQVLIMLEEMGLIERRRNVGAYVKAYTAKEVADLYAVRELLEGGAAERIAFPVAAERLQMLMAIQQRHDQAASAGDIRAIFHANIAFHQTLFALTDNAMLSAAIEDFARRAHVVRFSPITDARAVEAAREDHWKIIDALRNEDRQTLVDVCRRHLLPSLEAYLKQVHQQSTRA